MLIMIYTNSRRGTRLVASLSVCFSSYATPRFLSPLCRATSMSSAKTISSISRFKYYLLLSNHDF
jgi:hypothetical protein